MVCAKMNNSIIPTFFFVLCVFSISTSAGTTCTKHVKAKVRTQPPCGAMVVDQSGKHSQHTTVQAGVDALSTTDDKTQSLFIYPGVYHEQVVSSGSAQALSNSDIDDIASISHHDQPTSLSKAGRRMRPLTKEMPSMSLTTWHSST